MDSHLFRHVFHDHRYDHYEVSTGRFFLYRPNAVMWSKIWKRFWNKSSFRNRKSISQLLSMQNFIEMHWTDFAWAHAKFDVFSMNLNYGRQILTSKTQIHSKFYTLTWPIRICGEDILTKICILTNLDMLFSFLELILT